MIIKPSIVAYFARIWGATAIRTRAANVKPLACVARNVVATGASFDLH